MRSKSDARYEESYAQRDEDVTRSLMRSSVQGSTATNSATASGHASHVLVGLVFDEYGQRLSPSHSTKRIKRGGARRYTYYVSSSLVRGQSKQRILQAEGKQDMRLSATELDTLVMRMLRDHLDDHQWLASISNDDLPVDQTRRVIKRGAEVAEHLEAPQARALLQRVTIKPDAVVLSISQEPLAAMLEIGRDTLNDAPITIWQASSIVRSGRSTKLIIGSVHVTEPRVNQQLVDQLRQAHRWWRMLVTGKASSIAKLSKMERMDASEISRTITLAFLDPGITRMILKGTQPSALTLDALRRTRPLPANWKEQRQLLLG